MIKNSHCKINLSLAVLGRRSDGFSEVETAMVPVWGLRDTVEVERAERFSFAASGLAVDCAAEDNLCVRAWRLMEQTFGLAPAAVRLHKTIPFGAGLGAGSANAAAVVELCNEVYELNLTQERLRELCAALGSDTPFFIDPQPTVARGRGERLEPIDLDLSGWWLAMAKPDAGVSTKEAYAAVVPHVPSVMPAQAVRRPVEEWKNVCTNAFEEPIFRKIPLLGQLKQQMYGLGAEFALMSGSGSTVYGLFRDKPTLNFDCFTHIERL